MTKKKQFTQNDCDKTDCRTCQYRPKGHGCSYPQKTYKVYRWANGQVIDTFTGTKEKCIEYHKKWKNYTCEIVEI